MVHRVQPYLGTLPRVPVERGTIWLVLTEEAAPPSTKFSVLRLFARNATDAGDRGAEGYSKGAVTAHKIKGLLNNQTSRRVVPGVIQGPSLQSFTIEDSQLP